MTETGAESGIGTRRKIGYFVLLALVIGFVIYLAANGVFAFGEEVSETFGYCPEGITLPEGSACE